ncbi:hypothetical protein PGT21_020219 [Puccinia graminis f. sp. tritici]|uniref:Uncharacterized protein n=1 Tax=Puccinia graminis f. sp. tritici TaxID=56615 RepID=A0A5B0PDU4_PUCGR|nr:hypothetical protein PGT21_020219 [Puccinia graminis f. sp. tritici]
MNKFCQRQRLKAAHGLDCARKQGDKKQVEAPFEMDRMAYDQVLHFCRQTVPDLRAYYNLPHPPEAKVMFSLAKEIRSLEVGQGRRISKRKPNDIVEYISKDGELAYGQVCDIIRPTGIGHEHSDVIKVVSPVAYRRLPAWSLATVNPSYLIRPLGGLSSAPSSTNDPMELDP